MPSFRADDQMEQELAALETHLNLNTSDIIRKAVHRLWEHQFERVPGVQACEEILIVEPTVCAITGERLGRGIRAYRELLSNGQPGRILSRKGLAQLYNIAITM